MKPKKNVEIWQTLQGYEGYFLISNYGKLKVLGREICTGKNKKVRRYLREYVKNTYYIINGVAYYQVSLYGKKLMINISKAVAAAFVPNPNNYKFVRFKNRNIQDFYFKNLIWSKKGG